MSKLLLIAGVFFGAFVALQLVALLGRLLVFVLFPEWRSARDQLRSINEKSLAYAWAAASYAQRYFLWVVLAVFTLITLVYS
jgi:hypothetical protein